MSTSDDTSLIWGYNIASRLLSIIMLSYSLWLIELNLYPFWPAFCYCSVLKTAIGWKKKKKRIAFKIIRVFACSPVEGKDQIDPLNFFILGAISYCSAWFPQRRVLAETLSIWSIRFVVDLFNLPVMTEYLDDWGPVPVRVNPATQTL